MGCVFLFVASLLFDADRCIAFDSPIEAVIEPTHTLGALGMV